MPGLKELKAEIAKPAYNGKTDAEIVAMLNGPDATNPVPRKMTVGELMTKFSDASLTKLNKHPSLSAFRDDVSRQDHAAVLNWLGLVHKCGDITNAEALAAQSYVNETESGPPVANRVFGQTVTAGDLFWARRHN